MKKFPFLLILCITAICSAQSEKPLKVGEEALMTHENLSPPVVYRPYGACLPLF